MTFQFQRSTWPARHFPSQNVRHVATAPEIKEKRGSSKAVSIFNLAKGIMGAGAISLPGSISAIGDVKAAIAPAVTILGVMGFLSAYSFSMIGQECERYNATSFEEVWEKTLGNSTLWIISSSVVTTTFLACVAYSMIIGDLVSALASTLGFNLLSTRSSAIIGVTGCIVAPLCFLKNLSALSPTSFLGVFGVIFSTMVMGLRFFDGSYLPQGKYFKDLVLKPSFGNIRNGWKLDHMTFVILSCLGTAFLAHFNAPTFYNDLEDKSPAKFNSVISWAFGLSASIFMGMMVFGFGTFGSSTLGNVFMNYNPADRLATLCRFATALSITFTYPLAFVGLKKGVFSLLKNPNPSEKTNAVVTTLLLAFMTSCALILKDLGFVVR
jgi:sodium-coupled neutral amino acid transporter 11